MLRGILPSVLAEIIYEKLNFEKVYEIRIRAGMPIVINYGGNLAYLTENGTGSEEDGLIIPEKKLLESIVHRAAEHSLYAINDQLKNGFITMAGGYRVGVCGELVIEDGQIKTIKNFCSLNIRVPHEVKNCALNAYKYIADGGGVYNSLIISPPGCGKTTFLRDLARLISDSGLVQNTLIIDERYEIAAVTPQGPQLDVGKCSDILSNADKAYGFLQGIRCMSPHVIITDELCSDADISAVINACASGVKVIASAHSQSHLELFSRPHFDQLLKSKVIERFIVLSSRRGPGTYEGIYDGNFNALYYA